MNKHCKGCVYHYNAGHPKDSVYAKTHNDWCANFGMTAKKALGHCKLHRAKKVSDEWIELNLK